MGPLFASAFAIPPLVCTYAQILQTLIADNLDIYTYIVQTDRWTALSTPVAWAPLSVTSFEEGTKLIDGIGQVRLGVRNLQAQWKHDSGPELLRTSDDFPSPQFPGLRCFYHAEFGLWRVQDNDTGTEIPRASWPRGLTAATREGEPMPPGPVATEDAHEEEPN